VVDGQRELSDMPGIQDFDGEVVIDDRDGELLLTLLPRLKREWNATEQFRSLSSLETRIENLKGRKVSMLNISSLSEDDDEDVEDEFYALTEKTFENMDQVFLSLFFFYTLRL
jgi:hypothetical protein